MASVIEFDYLYSIGFIGDNEAKKTVARIISEDNKAFEIENDLVFKTVDVNGKFVKFQLSNPNSNDQIPERHAWIVCYDNSAIANSEEFNRVAVKLRPQRTYVIKTPTTVEGAENFAAKRNYQFINSVDSALTQIAKDLLPSARRAELAKGHLKFATRATMALGVASLLVLGLAGMFFGIAAGKIPGLGSLKHGTVMYVAAGILLAGGLAGSGATLYYARKIHNIKKSHLEA